MYLDVWQHIDTSQHDFDVSQPFLAVSSLFSQYLQPHSTLLVVDLAEALDLGLELALIGASVNLEKFCLSQISCISDNVYRFSTQYSTSPVFPIDTSGVPFLCISLCFGRLWFIFVLKTDSTDPHGLLNWPSMAAVYQSCAVSTTQGALYVKTTLGYSLGQNSRHFPGRKL